MTSTVTPREALATNMEVAAVMAANPLATEAQVRAAYERTIREAVEAEASGMDADMIAAQADYFRTLTDLGPLADEYLGLAPIAAGHAAREQFRADLWAALAAQAALTPAA